MALLTLYFLKGSCTPFWLITFQISMWRGPFCILIDDFLCFFYSKCFAISLKVKAYYYYYRLYQSTIFDWEVKHTLDILNEIDVCLPDEFKFDSHVYKQIIWKLVISSISCQNLRCQNQQETELKRRQLPSEYNDYLLQGKKWSWITLKDLMPKLTLHVFM